MPISEFILIIIKHIYNKCKRLIKDRIFADNCAVREDIEQVPLANAWGGHIGTQARGTTMTSEAAILQSIEGEPMTLEGVAANGTVNGLLFELTVEQRYCNPSTTNIEAVYTFPLPFGAVLLDLDVELNGKTLTGIVVEKAVAEAQYEVAIDKGDTAIMLERAANGLCTVNLGNLMAGERATNFGTQRSARTCGPQSRQSLAKSLQSTHSLSGFERADSRRPTPTPLKGVTPRQRCNRVDLRTCFPPPVPTTTRPSRVISSPRMAR